VNLGAAAALLEVRVKELQDVLREHASEIQVVEKAQIRLEEARQALEQAIAKHPATDTAKPDAASEYIARMRDPYAAYRPTPRRN
jgi:ABC-type sugar transport system substrate-binding protein